ncbi:hypothetical protein BTJ40_03410 [Microbulbifer sp. A4B17]|nr:hypothetical protein BTJ40_03410 [Microbulbifer sp. A4B17]
MGQHLVILNCARNRKRDLLAQIDLGTAGQNEVYRKKATLKLQFISYLTTSLLGVKVAQVNKPNKIGGNVYANVSLGNR